MTTTTTTTTRSFPLRLRQALTERIGGLADTSRPEGPAFLAAAAGTELAKAIGSGPLEKLCKPLIVPAALVVALRDGRLTPVDGALLSATAAGYTTGDVILMLGGGHSGRSDAGRSRSRLVAGAAAFGVGHLALGGLLLRSGLRFRPRQVAVHGAIAGAAGAVLLSEDRANAPLAAYGGVLAALSALATSVDHCSGPAASVLAVAGPVFLLSDALILVRRRAEAGSALARAVGVGVIDTYATAALLLLTGAAAAAREAGRAA